MGAEGGTPGWRKSNISGEQYINLLLAYNAELEKDDYVLGATPFTSGPTAQWANFDMDGDSWRIPGGVPPVIPDMVEEPMPEEIDELAFYAKWCLERRANKQDPRIGADFRSHLKAINIDPRRAYELGWPVKPRTAKPKPAMTVLDTRSIDIGPTIESAAKEYSIPVALLLAGIKAESGLNPRAERWGTRTTEAKTAILHDDWDALATVIVAAGSDISFGFGQRIVPYHYYGDRRLSVENCLNVRAYVFAHPEEDIAEMAKLLSSHYQQALSADLSPVGGNASLMALAAYNSGHIPKPGASYWSVYAGHVASYRAALDWAGGIVG